MNYMKKYLLVLLFNFFGYSQVNCEKFQEGVFQYNTPYGNFLIERHNNFQLEKCPEYNIVYLHKIEKNSDNNCDYILRRYKIIDLGILPKPDMNEAINTTIYKIEDNVFFFYSSLIGTDFKIYGEFKKISDEISDEFKKMLIEEGR
jgi:hypothetical protein